MSNNSLLKRLDEIEKRIETIESTVYGNRFKKLRDDRWEEFVRVIKLQEKHQKNWN